MKLAIEIKSTRDHLNSFRWERKVRNLSKKKSRWGDIEASFMLLLKNFTRKWYLTLPKVSRVQRLSLKLSISQQLPKNSVRDCATFHYNENKKIHCSLTFLLFITIKIDARIASFWSIFLRVTLVLHNGEMSLTCFDCFTISYLDLKYSYIPGEKKPLSLGFGRTIFKEKYKGRI